MLDIQTKITNINQIIIMKITVNGSPHTRQFSIKRLMEVNYACRKADMHSRPDSFREKESELLFEKAELATFISEQFEEYQRIEIMEYD